MQQEHGGKDVKRQPDGPTNRHKNDPLVRVGYFLQHAMRFHPPWLPSNLIVTTLSLAPVNLGQQAFRSGLSPMFAHAITAAENAQRGAVVQDAIQKTC